MAPREGPPESGATESGATESGATESGATDGGDEELLDTRRPSWSRRRRHSATGAAVVLLAVVGVVAYVHHDGKGAPAAAPTVPSSAASSTAAPVPALVTFAPPVVSAAPVPKPTGDVPYQTGSDAAKCPGMACTTRASVPATVVGAIRSVFPGIHIGRVTTVRLASGRRPLWFREVTATSARRLVQLVIQAHSPSDVNHDYIRIEPPAVVTYVERDLDQWHVIVTVTTPTQRDRVFGQALDLATDKRILAT